MKRPRWSVLSFEVQFLLFLFRRKLRIVRLSDGGKVELGSGRSQGTNFVETRFSTFVSQKRENCGVQVVRG